MGLLIFLTKYGNALGISEVRSLGTATDIQFCKKKAMYMYIKALYVRLADAPVFCIHRPIYDGDQKWHICIQID